MCSSLKKARDILSRAETSTTPDDKKDVVAEVVEYFLEVEYQRSCYHHDQLFSLLGQNQLQQIASDTSGWSTKREAIGRIKEDRRLKELLEEEGHWAEREFILRKIQDEGVLLEILKERGSYIRRYEHEIILGKLTDKEVILGLLDDPNRKLSKFQIFYRLVQLWLNPPETPRRIAERVLRKNKVSPLLLIELQTALPEWDRLSQEGLALSRALAEEEKKLERISEDQEKVKASEKALPSKNLVVFCEQILPALESERQKRALRIAEIKKRQGEICEAKNRLSDLFEKVEGFAVVYDNLDGAHNGLIERQPENARLLTDQTQSTDPR